MPVISIRHLTTYRYRKPVAFGEHRMMLRPQESHDQRVLSADLRISPDPSLLQHVHDVSGASVAVARFEQRAEVLSFDSHVRLEHITQVPRPELANDVIRGGQAFCYEALETPDLARSISRRHEDADGALAAFARRFLRSSGETSLLDLFSAMSWAIHDEFAYALRLQGAPQTPAETLARRSGSCRDFAVLLMEAARALGVAAQFVTGYVYSSAKGGRTGGGHTHAWARLYMPSLGWVDFDPTNGLIGNVDLIRVASACDPRQVLPLHGTWAGEAGDYIGMDVEVDVSAEEARVMQPAVHLRVAQRR